MMAALRASAAGGVGCVLLAVITMRKLILNRRFACKRVKEIWLCPRKVYGERAGCKSKLDMVYDLAGWLFSCIFSTAAAWLKTINSNLIQSLSQFCRELRFA